MEHGIHFQKTRSAFLWTNLLNAPFWAMYNLLVFILYKDLHATALQVTIMITLKPVVSILSTYWSGFVNKRRDRLLSNVILAGVIGHAPFFFFPFIDNAWFYIGSAALYMMLTRGVIPAWMEILKLNIPEIAREKVFAYGSTISYVGGIILPLFFGSWLDADAQVWRWMFPALAAISLVGMVFQWRIPIEPGEEKKPFPFSWKEQCVQPWKNTWHLMRTRPDFAKFQVGFMLGGAGLMIMQPALPAFFVDDLKLSYTELAIALSVCKGIGYATTARVWAHWMPKIDIFRFSGMVTVLACLFPLALLCAKSQLAWLYLAYAVYGIMQAGSELSWHLSGPIFAKDEDSSAYSGVNVIMVGLRGCFAPVLGSLLCGLTNASAVLISGGLLCALATLQLHYVSKRHREAQSDAAA